MRAHIRSRSNSCARALGILSIVIVVIIQNEVRCFFFLRLIGECATEVPRATLAASLGAFSNV